MGFVSESLVQQGGKQLEKDPRLLPASRLMRCLCAAASYSILHLAGLTLVWYNAEFELF